MAISGAGDDGHGATAKPAASTRTGATARAASAPGLAPAPAPSASAPAAASASAPAPAPHPAPAPASGGSSSTAEPVRAALGPPPAALPASSVPPLALLGLPSTAGVDDGDDGDDNDRDHDRDDAEDVPTAGLPAGHVPTIAPLARIAAGLAPAHAGLAPAPAGLAVPLPPVLPARPAPARSRPRAPTAAPSLTTAADALRDEEVERTRLFIRMGWALSVVVMLTFPFVDAPRAMSAVLGVGLAIGVIVSFVFHRRFADPRAYTERALLVLSVICVINGHIGVLYYGAFTAAPLMVVVGIHFVGRTEAERVARWIFVSALICYSAIALAIISGLIADPGVFASDRPIGRATLVTATVFVLGTFWLAYYTARMFRTASLASIEDLQSATRLASQREALMDELRGELERALRVGGPGRYTDQVVGGFRLGVVLGRGAMGEVYDAVRASDGAPAAVKLLRRELLTDATQVARFLREARAGGALDSPFVVRVLDAAGGDDALPYLAMERLTGATLAEGFRRDARLPAAETLELCRQVGAGIDAAAAAGIVHRDLKPQNLFRCEGGTWKILDFGAAMLADNTGTLTLGEVVGTPHYMAPEQAQGKRVDRRADVYSLAAIVYRCLTGRHPYHGPDTPALLYAVVHRTPARPGELAELPPDVDRWCALALAKAPDDRFPSGAALADALADALAGALAPRLRKRADAMIRRRPWEPA